MTKPRPRRSAASLEQRRLRIMAMAPDSFIYQEIAETEELSRDRVRQIVVESLKRGDPDKGDHRRIQVARDLDGAGRARRYFALRRARAHKSLKKHETAVDSFRLAPRNAANPTLPLLKSTPEMLLNAQVPRGCPFWRRWVGDRGLEMIVKIPSAAARLIGASASRPTGGATSAWRPTLRSPIFAGLRGGGRPGHDLRPWSGGKTDNAEPRTIPAPMGR